ncbi:MAG TPA: ATP-binding protein [Blastocatellia bacterium]|nr:ATP-binding protein [Blastocatellia bacterium]
MQNRFILDRKENILFINFADLRIESREQVDEFARIVREAYRAQGRRLYAIVNYEGTEITPEIIDYYGEVIKELQDRYAIRTVRYSSNGFTRSALRYLGAAKDLESNTYATREEAVRAIQELESRSIADSKATISAMLNPRRSILGKVALVWSALIAVLFVVYFCVTISINDPQQIATIRAATITTMAMLVIAAAMTGAVLFFTLIKPLRRMEAVARRLAVAGVFEPVEAKADTEIDRLARALNEASAELRRDIERLSGLYHISLMIGTGTEVSKICELLTRKTARLLGAEMCVILLYDERDQSIRAQLPAYGIDDEKVRLLRSRLGERSLAAFVFKTGEPYLTNDVTSDSHADNEAARALGVKNVLAVPLQAGERLLGVIDVMNKESGFVEEDRRLVTIFASQAAQILANAQLFKQLIVSERLAAVGELIAGVAHEVRNPLFGITTTLSALSHRLEDREAVRPFIDVVMTEVDRLNHLMEQLLEHSRPARLDEVVDIRGVIEEVLGEFSAQAREKKITVEFHCAESLPGLRLDRRKMHGVFTNLLDNALQHTAPDGCVRVAVEVVENGRAEIEIELSDTGAGIAPENLNRVFDPFFTTRATGTGLGLAIVRKTIHDHGGAIAVRSEVGKGTAFSIHLPVQR